MTAIQPAALEPKVTVQDNSRQRQKYCNTIVATIWRLFRLSLIMLLFLLAENHEEEDEGRRRNSKV